MNLFPSDYRAVPYLENREISWLRFNLRVLEEARDNGVPLVERLRFVAIFCSNLDEFFMIRVGSLLDQTLVKNISHKKDNKTHLTATEQLKLISGITAKLISEKDRVYHDVMRGILLCGAAQQVSVRSAEGKDAEFLKRYFGEEILPLLTPSIIDKRHPVQFLKNMEIYVGTVLRRRDSEKTSPLIGVLPATGVFRRVIYLPDNGSGMVRFVLAENLILHYADSVYANYEVVKRNIFRITRNADIDADEASFDHDIDFRGMMEELLKKRKKLAPVRIEFGTYTDMTDRERITSKLNLDLRGEFVFAEDSPLDFSFVGELGDKLKDRTDLFYQKRSPRPSPHIDPDPANKLMKQLDKGDLLLSYPYEQFKQFIRLVDEAAADPDVVSIKITLYRIAPESQLVAALVAAAENGKDVLAVVELRARFDEENNIDMSRRLQDAGATVCYGLSELKVHSKLLLITKRGGGTAGIRYYTQIGTGNYNERTSQAYTDLSLMTADPAIGADASLVFNALAVGMAVESTGALWVAPHTLKSRVTAMIDGEIARKSDGYIGLKLNGLTDRDLIEKLVEAGQNGVTVELIVRGMCCLIPGVRGKTENIRVISIVGRFLEHSRVYIFGRGERAKVYISSADFMTRNTEKRVEVAAPVRDKVLAQRIADSFDLMLSDNVKARVMLPTGEYIRRNFASDDVRIDSQVYFYEAAYTADEAAKQKRGAKKKVTVFKRIGRFFKKLFRKNKKTE